jgi:signal transduction histidine kinase
VVQESLTNALRHAPGSAVDVVVTAGDDGLEITVEDDGPGPAEAARRGFGLVGLGERVALLGGELSAGRAGPGGGFRVHARLPAGAPAVRA